MQNQTGSPFGLPVSDLMERFADKSGTFLPDIFFVLCMIVPCLKKRLKDIYHSLFHIDEDPHTGTVIGRRGEIKIIAEQITVFAVYDSVKVQITACLLPCGRRR